MYRLKGACSEEYPWDLSILVHMLQRQHTSLEQITAEYRGGKLTAGTFGTSFRKFPKLKRLSMPRTFLVRLIDDGDYCLPWYDEESYMDYGMKELHLALPPALEELVLNIDDDVKFLEDGERPQEDLKELFKQVAVHKQELYPSLKRVVLWTSCDLDEFTPAEIDAKEKEMDEMLEFSVLFKDVGVEFVYKVSPVKPGFQDRYVFPDTESGKKGADRKAVGT